MGEERYMASDGWVVCDLSDDPHPLGYGAAACVNPTAAPEMELPRGWSTCKSCGLGIRPTRASSSGWVHVGTKRKACEGALAHGAARAEPPD